MNLSVLAVSMAAATLPFLCATAGTAIVHFSHHNSVCLFVHLSVRPSHGWIGQKRCKLGSKSLLSAARKTLISGSVKLFYKFDRVQLKLWR